MAEANLTASRLRELLFYSEETGLFVWRERHGKKIVGGEIAGNFSERRGYVDIRIDGNKYRAQRLVYLYIYGAWPESLVDHIDRDRKNNRLSNLRLASPSENLRNTGMYSSNTSGSKGVYKAGNRWKSLIRVDYKLIHLGYFLNKEDAVKARASAEQKHFGEFAPTYS